MAPHGRDAEMPCAVCQTEADQLRLAVAEALCRTPKRRNDFKEAVKAVQAEDNLPR